jgi:predicted O-methyltransferase YrrM
VNARRRALADELYAAGRAHDERQADRLDRWRNVEPETAELLAVLVRAMGARRALEIGTSNGYAERPAYAGYWPALVRVLATPGLLAVDNVVSHAAEVADLRALVDADARVTSSLVPIGAGVLFVAPVSAGRRAGATPTAR